MVTKKERGRIIISADGADRSLFNLLILVKMRYISRFFNSCLWVLIFFSSVSRRGGFSLPKKNFFLIKCIVLVDELSLFQSCFQVYPLAFIININNGLDCFRLYFAVFANAENGSWILEWICIVCVWEYCDDVIALFLNSSIHWFMWPNNQGNIVVCHELVDANLPITKDIF